MTQEKFELLLKQNLSPSISFEGSFRDLTSDIENAPPRLGWLYWFTQGNLCTYTVIFETIFSRLSDKLVMRMSKGIESILKRGTRKVCELQEK